MEITFKSDTMQVSIITPSFNCENWILHTYESIKNQSVKDWEWLITDDCSTDNTLRVLKNIQNQDDRVKVFTNKVNSGAAVSRNTSLKNAKGKFIAFLDSDDIWLPEKLETQIKFMGEDINFSFTAYELINAEGKSLGKTVDRHLKGSINYEGMLRKKATLGCSTVMLRRNAFENIAMPLIRTGQDYALWLTLLKEGAVAVPIIDVLTKYRILPDSISRNKFKKARRQWQIYRKIESLSLYSSLVCFLFYAWRAVFRK